MLIFRKLGLVLVGVLLTTYLKSQTREFHVNQSGSYSMLAESNSVKSSKNIDNGTVEYFEVNNDDGVFQYYYSVTSLELGVYVDVNNDDYIKSFQSECGCDLNSVAKTSFNNLSGG